MKQNLQRLYGIIVWDLRPLLLAVGDILWAYFFMFIKSFSINDVKVIRGDKNHVHLHVH